MFTADMTGISTPAGWKVHEWIWRDSLDGISARISDIDYLYSTSIDTEEVKKIIKKYDIKGTGVRLLLLRSCPRSW